MVRAAKDRKQVNKLLSEEKLGSGEAEAIVLFKEAKADYLLTSDRYASLKAAKLGLKTITIGNIIRLAYDVNVIIAK